MKQWEYEALQAALTKKSENNPYGHTGNFKREDGLKVRRNHNAISRKTGVGTDLEPIPS